MSTEGSKKAILAAMLANFGIAIAKFIAWGLSGSSSMLGEGVHSLADTGNQILLLRGGSVSKKKPDADHPFGFGRERYVYAFVVSIILFSVGGVFSLYEGVDKIQHPHELENAWIPIAVLLVAMVLEFFSLRTAVRESNRVRGKDSWIAFIRHAKAPELPVVLLEDVAALTGLLFAFVGVVLTIATGDAVWDAIGTICIGVLLVLVAIVLGIETKSLLVGEGATADDTVRIRDAINADSDVESLIHMKTLYLGPEELLVAAKVAFPTKMKLAEVAAAINSLEARVRALTRRGMGATSNAISTAERQPRSNAARATGQGFMGAASRRDLQVPGIQLQAVGQPLQQRRVMRGDQQGRAACRRGVHQQGANLPPGSGVQAGRRLVRKQDRGLPQQRAGKGNPLALATAKHGGPTAWVRNAQAIQQLQPPRAQGIGDACMVEQGRQQHIVQGGQARQQVHVLEHQAQPRPPPTVPRPARHGPKIIAVPPYGASGRTLNPSQRVQ